MTIIFECLFKGHEFTEAEKTARREHADDMFGLFTAIANEMGYAIARHGSGVRDIDLVAIPWTKDAVGCADLVLGLASRLILTLGHFAYDKPHKRFAVAMWHSDFPDQQIDLSVMPRATE